METFKNVFNEQLVGRMATQFAKHHDDFDHHGFIRQASKDFDLLELKARSNQIVDAMVEYLPKEFDSASKVIKASLAPPSEEEKHPNDNANKGLRGWAIMPMADYVALCGKSAKFEKQHALKPITTRVYYPGVHFIEIIINGQSMQKQGFELLM